MRLGEVLMLFVRSDVGAGKDAVARCVTMRQFIDVYIYLALYHQYRFSLFIPVIELCSFIIRWLAAMGLARATVPLA